MPTAINKTKSEQKFWANPNHWAIYKLFKGGKGVMEIAEELNMRPFWVEETVCSPFFAKKIEHYLNSEIFSFQTGRIRAVNEVFMKLWKRVQDNIDEIPPVDCLKELMKLIPARSESLKLQDPKQYNLLMLFGDSKTKDPEQSEGSDVSESFGFQGLEQDEESKINPQLDTRKQAEDKQIPAD